MKQRNIEQFKIIYESLEKNNWLFEELKKLADIYQTNITIIKKRAMIYAKEILYLDEKEVEEKIKKSQEIDEIKTMQKKRFCYEYCIFFAWNKKKIEELASRMQLTPDTIRRLAKEYAIDVLKIPKKEIIEEILTNSRNIPRGYAKPKYYSFIEKLVLLEKDEEIIELFKTYDSNLNKSDEKINLSELKRHIDNYCEEKKDLSLIKSLENKIKVYNEYVKKIRHETVSKIEEEKIIKEFLSKDKTVSEFCVEKGIDKKTFMMYITKIEKYSKELYKSYFLKLQELDFKEALKKKDLIKQVIYYIENGIVINGKIRKFDLLDYNFITNIRYDDLLNKARLCNFSENDLDILKKFFRKNGAEQARNYSLDSIRKVIMEGNYYICCKFSNGVMIENKEVTKDEKRIHN